MPKRLSSLQDIASLLAQAHSLYVSGCAAEIPELERLLAGLDVKQPLTVSGIFIPGVNTLDYAAVSEQVRCKTFFMTPQMGRANHNRIEYCPWRYRDILRYYHSNPSDVSLVMLSPPDADGYCSYGVTSDFAPLVLPKAGIRVALINPQMPRVRGAKVALDCLDYYLDIDAPLLEVGVASISANSETIADNVVSYVEDGATLQLGLGSIPGAVVRKLHDRRQLRIHSGLIESAVLELDEAGALCPDSPIVSGVALGDTHFYQQLHENQRVAFNSVDTTHDSSAIAAIESFTAINGALQVDLLGQVNSTVLASGFVSGPGGLPEFVAGSLGSEGGRSIIALNATARGGEQSRIVPQLQGGMPSVAFADADIVVTEFGAAELRGKSLAERMEQMIAIADPRHRDALAQATFAVR